MLWWLFPLLVVLPLLGISSCGVLSEMGTLPGREEVRRFERLPYFRAGKFRNAEAVELDRNKIARSGGFARLLFHSDNAPKRPLPALKPVFGEKSKELSVVWLGHSSLIFEWEGMRFASDPVFFNASPLPFVVRRYGACPLSSDDLPELDFVLITHDHYDHLERSFIRGMRNWNGRFLVPSGVGARLRAWGIAPERIRELELFETETIGGLKITLLPTRHFSGRSFSDRDRTLWGGFMVENSSEKIFTGGDGGYGRHFAEIGKKFGPFSLVALEIDAWNEAWPNNHLFPQEVFQAFSDLSGKVLLPIHYGVFDLARHPWDESIREIWKIAFERNIPIAAPRPGERFFPSKTLPVTPWWESPTSARNSE